MRASVAPVALAVVLALVLAACRGARTPAATPGEFVSSTVRRADYAGSAACARCHGDVAAAWAASAMHRMTRLASAAQIQAPFDGRAFELQGDRAELLADGAERFVRVRSVAAGTHVFRVTKVIGGRVREDFAGVEVAAARADAATIGDPHDETILPVTWLLEPRTLRYKGYSVMAKDRPGLSAGPIWNQTCIFCHNTVPWLSTALGELAGTSGYQGSIVDRFLPKALRWKLEVTDEPALRRALVDELSFLAKKPLRDHDAPLDKLVRATLRETKLRLGEHELVEVGIGCEMCHGGAREHVEAPRVHPSFAPTSPFLKVSGPENRAQWINRACARCHQVLFSGYAWTWEGGARADAQSTGAGGSNVSSGEGRDFMMGACATKLSCTQCHDPHPRPGARRDPERAGNEVCASCHSKYASKPAIRAHAHHDPEGAGGACLACHMPKKNLGLDGRLTRYHRIGAPNDAARVEGDRPLECALCHERATVASLVDTMERWWGKRFDRAAMRARGVDFEAPALLVALRGGRPHEIATAAFVLGERRVREAIPDLVRALAVEVPFVRGYVVRALEAIVAAPAPFDLHTRGPAAQEQARAWLGAKGISVDVPPRDEKPRERRAPTVTGPDVDDE